MDQGVYWIIASIGVLITALAAVVNYFRDLNHRKQDLRWKKAGKAKELIDELFGSVLAKQALKIVDRTDKKVIVNGTNYTVSQKMVGEVLSKDFDAESVSVLEDYLYKCFDELFYYLHMMEHYIQAKLIDPEDVDSPLAFYIKYFRFDEQTKTFTNEDFKNKLLFYAKKIGDIKVSKFVDRIERSSVYEELSDYIEA